MAALFKSPIYLIFDFGIPLLIATVTDRTVTALALGSVAIGFAVGWFWAAAIFFLAYGFMRTLNLTALSLANALGYIGQVQRQAQVRMPSIANLTQVPGGSDA